MDGPIHGSSAGLMDLAGFEKPGFYRRKAFWSTEPFACILTRPDDGDEHEWRPWNAHWNYTDGENVVVRVFTNVQKETISLSIVGIDGEKSLPRWNISLKKKAAPNGVLLMSQVYLRQCAAKPSAAFRQQEKQSSCLQMYGMQKKL